MQNRACEINMEIPVLIALTLIIAILLGISFSRRRTERGGGDAVAERTDRTCPLCGSGLEPGERVKSVFYPAPGDTLAEIHGCKYCVGPDAIAARRCPVCKATIPPDGHVIARVFKRPDKTHIHVLGCTTCRRA